jgi:HK97 gp10 family phage protein
MSFGIKAEITGLDDAFKLLKKLKKGGLQRKVLRAAVSKATTVVLKSAKGRVPVESGLLKKSLGRKIKTYARTGTVVGVIGPRLGFGRDVVINGHTEYRDPKFYAHLVENGTVTAAAQPFLRPAWDENLDQIKELMKREIADGVTKELARVK